jgi:hypothetical protein
MMPRRTTRPKSIVISVLALSFALMICAAAFAADKAGTVTHLSGPLFAKKADGSTRALSINSVVEQGDTLITEKRTYARIKFTDEGEMVLRPGTQFKVSSYQFDHAAPEKDKAVFNLVKGGIRSITGRIGKRGDQGSYRMETPTAVAGVRGTTYECRICAGNCGAIPDGLYLFVLEGMINVSNTAGSQDVKAGQYVYVSSAVSIPKILPEKPVIDFSLSQAAGVTKQQEGPVKGDSCIVR